MVTYGDCLALSELTAQAVETVAAREHLPQIVALEFACCLAAIAPDPRPGRLSDGTHGNRASTPFVAARPRTAVAGARPGPPDGPCYSRGAAIAAALRMSCSLSLPPRGVEPWAPDSTEVGNGSNGSCQRSAHGALARGHSGSRRAQGRWSGRQCSRGTGASRDEASRARPCSARLVGLRRSGQRAAHPLFGAVTARRAGSRLCRRTPGGRPGADLPALRLASYSASRVRGRRVAGGPRAARPAAPSGRVVPAPPPARSGRTEPRRRPRPDARSVGEVWIGHCRWSDLARGRAVGRLPDSRGRERASCAARRVRPRADRSHPHHDPSRPDLFRYHVDPEAAEATGPVLIQVVAPDTRSATQKRALYRRVATLLQASAGIRRLCPPPPRGLAEGKLVPGTARLTGRRRWPQGSQKSAAPPAPTGPAACWPSDASARAPRSW